MATSVLSEVVPYVMTDVNAAIDVYYNPFRGLFRAIEINGKSTTVYTPSNYPHMAPYNEGVVPARVFKQEFDPIMVQKKFYWDHAGLSWKDEGESSTLANIERIQQIAQGYAADAQKLLETSFFEAVNPNTIKDGNNLPWNKASKHSADDNTLRGISHERILSAISQVMSTAGHIKPNTTWYVFLPYSLKNYIENDSAFFYSNSGVARTPQTIQAQQAQYNYKIVYLNDNAFFDNDTLWEDDRKVLRIVIVPSTAVVQGVWTPFGGAMYNMKLCQDYGSVLGYDGFYMVSKFVTSFTLVRPDIAIWVGARLTA